MFGLTVEEAGGSPVDVWPDNLEAVNVFITMGTQWRVGVGGASGLDYSAIPHVMDLCGVKKQDQKEIFESVRVMEIAALNKMRENNG